MMTEEAEDACGRQKQVESSRAAAGGNICRSFTTLSTIAIQAGQSQIVASVLKSGSLVHVQLVQVQPGLCEIGSNQEENHVLIQEQQQLLEKLKKHEPEVLAVVEKKEAEPRRDGRTTEQKKREEAELHHAMKASLSEGWSLLLHLLERRLEVLMLTSDFYCRALEFAASIDRFEDLRIGPGEDGPTEVQLSYDSMRRDVLGKSLQVLGSSSILLQKLRQLQRTEALQRRGGVLQDEEDKSSQSSRGATLRLEELVEELQDRRRRADQAVGLRLQQLEGSIPVQKAGGESRETISDGWTLPEPKILEQNPPSGSTSADRQSHSGSETRALKPGSGSDRTRDVEPGSGSEDSRKLESGSGSDRTRDVEPGCGSEDSRKLESGSGSDRTRDVEPGSGSEDSRKLESGSGSDRTRDVEPGCGSEDSRKLESGSGSDRTRDVEPGSGSEDSRKLESGSGSDRTRDVEPGSGSEDSRKLESGSGSDRTRDVEPGSGSEDSRKLESGSGSDRTRDVEPGCGSEDSRKLESGSGSDLQTEFRADQKLSTRSDQTRNPDLEPESSLDQTTDLKSGSRSDETKKQQLGFRYFGSRDLRGSSLELLLEETRNFKLGSRSDLKPDSVPEETRDLTPRFKSTETTKSRSETKESPESGSEMKSRSRSDEPRDLQPDSTSGETKDLQPGCCLDLQTHSGSEETKDSQSGFSSELKNGSSSEVQPETGSARRSDSESKRPGTGSDETRKLHEGSKPVETRDSQSGFGSVLQHRSRSDVQTGSGSDVKPGSRSEETGTLQSGSGSEVEDVSLSAVSSKQDKPKQNSAAGAAGTSSWGDGGGQVADLQSMLGKDSPHGEDPAHRFLLTNQRQQLLLSFERLEKKVCSGLQQISSVLLNSSEAGRQLSEAKHTLNTHLQLHSQAQSAVQDVQNLNRILDQLRNLQHPTSRIGPPPRSDPSSQLSPLKALTEQLKRGCSGTQTRTRTARLSPRTDGSLVPELTGRVDLVLKELQSLRAKIESNLQLLQPFVSFLRTTQQVEEEMEALRKMNRRLGEEEEDQTKVETCCQEALQRILGAQELGNNCLRTVTTVSGSGLNLQPLLLQQVMQRLDKTKQEVDELQAEQQVQQQQDMKFCRRYQERLTKTLQDLNCVSELLDSCTLMDLGSDLQTSKLLDSFRRARPHFSQLDNEVEYMGRSWESLRGVQDRLKEVEGGAVREEDLSELQKLHQTVKQKIQQSESILERTSSFHLTAQQLEALLQSEPTGPSIGSTGSCRADEAQQQIENLLQTSSTLKMDICTAVTHSAWTGFQVEQLDARLRSLDSLCGSWLNEAARREEKQRREQPTRLLHGDISQLHSSFKELKRRFSNTKFNYLKRNDRTRNMKAVRNQLQQVELYEEKLQVRPPPPVLYEEKLQALRKRVHGVTARLGLEVKDGGVARQVEDAANELHRQMGEFERSVCEHQKTLDMTCRLQQAMEEYQFWCEEASATIARVGTFSLECRSTEAVSVLYRQFEKFMWPTVPQQEERISQITELAVRLHGVEEGRRYIEKMVSKHSEMVESIRQLSDGLMELEAKLKLENLKQNDEEKEIKEMEDKKKMKEKRKMKKKKEQDNCSTQETADMHELKETGHTPELTAEYDGKEAPVRRQAAANRKPPLRKGSSQETDRQEVQSESRPRQTQSELFTSYFSSHTLSISCSPVEADRKLHAVHSQSQLAATEPQARPSPSVIGPSFSDIQKEFQKKEMQEKAASASCGSNIIPPQNASTEAEFQQQEAMTEDSLSNDEYECVSPDDISLPPLAETPESNMFQSDVEENFCFSSHSIHISQYSHQDQAQAEKAGTCAATGAIPQKHESTQREGCPTPSISLHRGTRFRSESSSSPRLFTSTLCTILRTTETNNFPRGADLSLNNSESRKPCGSNPVHQSSTTDTKDIPESPSLTQNAPTPQAKGPTPDPHSSNTPVADVELHKCTFDYPQSQTVISENISWTQLLHQDITSIQNLREASPQRNSSGGLCTGPQDRNHPAQESSSSLRGTKPRIDPVPKPKEFAESPKLIDAILHKNTSQAWGTDPSKPCTTIPQTSTSPQEIKLPQSSTSSRKGLDQDVPTSKARKDTASTPRGSSLTTATTLTQQTVCCQSFPAEGSQPGGSFEQDSRDPPEGHSNISISSRFTGPQTVQPLPRSLTCAQQRVHGPGMRTGSPAQSAAPPQPEALTQAPAQQSNPHVTPSSSPHLLTPNQDPDICLPTAIREEIRLTPQIQGPPLPPPPLAQAEPLPQGKPSRPGPPCFTRPLSQATVMEGSPVTLEVEVMGHPEPRLTWLKDGEVSASTTCLAPSRDQRKSFLFPPEAADPEGGLSDASRHDPQPAAANSSSGDRWLVAEVCDIISVDFHSWFGTLCVLLWLLYLLLL